MSRTQFSVQNAQGEGLRPSLVLLLACGAGLAMASLYYAQPLLGVLGDEMRAAPGTIGLIPTLTQLGYALGIFFMAPLGDRYERRRIIVIKCLVLCLALLSASAAPGAEALLVASLVVGLATTVAQDIVPAAATLAPDQSRGKVVGTVMTGLLLGILLSRVVSGVIAEHFGWRTVFQLAATSIALFGLVAWRQLPKFQPTTQLPYLELIGSMGALWVRHPDLRRASMAQGLLSMAFSAFWSTLAVMLHGEPFHLGSAAAGAFGIAGAAGALVAPMAGRLSDRKGPELVTRLGAGLVVISFAAMAFGPLLSNSAHLAVLIGAAVTFDLGIQATVIAHQSIIYSIDPESRSRLNAVLYVGMFGGMAIGSALGAYFLARWGWLAVIALACTSSSLGLALRMAGKSELSIGAGPRRP